MSAAAIGRRRVHAALVVLSAALAYGVISAVHRSANRPFWFDEIATVAVVESPTGVLAALDQGADANPPPFYWLTALGRQVVRDRQIAYRIPSVAGFLALTLALFWFVHKRFGPLAGATAALIPFTLPLFTFYAVEARPYALMTGFVAWALVAWQAAGRRGGALVLGLLLAAAAACHYLAVFALLPFVFAEIGRSIRLRRLRPGVWIALIAGCVPLVAFWPLLSRFRQGYGAAFWARPRLLAMYDELLGVSDRWASPLTIVLAASVVAAFVKRPPAPEGQSAAPMPPEEGILILGFVFLPVFVYAAAVLTHGVEVPRYAASAVIGVSLAAIVAVRSYGERGIAWLLALVLSIVAMQQIDYWRYGSPASMVATDHADLPVLRSLMRRGHAPALPVVVSNGLRYLPMAYYGGTVPDPDCVFLLDAARAVRTVGTDSVERALVSLAPYVPMKLYDTTSFFAAHPAFLLYSENLEWDWLPSGLAQDGHSVRLLAEERSSGAHHTLYRVDLRAPDPLSR